MAAPERGPDVSLIVEYETAPDVGDDRAREIVLELARQAREVPYEVEVLLPRDAPLSDELFTPLRVRRFDVPGERHYYEVKNAGARAAHGLAVVFADADVVALDGWLTALIKGLDDPAVDVAVGTTVIRPVDTVRQKVFAASTWFPVDAEDVRPQLFANNFAVRPELFLPDGFPPIGCRHRGSCRQLDQQWRRSDVRVEAVREAVSYHPPPVHAFRRALWHGHDQYVERARSPFVVGLLRVSLHQLALGTKRLFVNRARVGLRWRELPIALAYNVAETAGRAAGFTLARFAHGFFHRHLAA
jgi:hypothetical protein